MQTITATVRGTYARRWFRSAMTLLWLAAPACDMVTETVTPPGVGYILLKLTTTGGDLDLDGYDVAIDGVTAARITQITGLQSVSAQSGTHTVELRRVDANCVVEGPNARSVDVVKDQIVSVSIEIVCMATGITVSTRTTGPDSPANVRVVVDDRPPVVLTANGAQIISRLTPGSHAITLLTPAHCTVAGGDRTTVAVAEATITDVAFSVTCVPVTRRERIAYANQLGITTRWIELVDVDGSNVERLEVGDAPAWSPDGRELAYSDARCDLDPWYYAPYCTGGILIQDPEIGDFRRPTQGQLGFDPSWSPARNELLFGYFDGRLKLFDLTTSVTTPMFIDGPISMRQAAWSPDGERIAFVCSGPPPITTDLCVAQRDGTGLVRLTNDAAREGRPAWSPDGTRLAFAKYPPTEGAPPDIALLDLGSLKVSALGRGWDPAWSPDGSKLVFGTNDGLFVMNADGSDRARLTTGLHYAPAWRPR